jgi:putative sigma-54 modulation protein
VQYFIWRSSKHARRHGQAAKDLSHGPGVQASPWRLHRPDPKSRGSAHLQGQGGWRMKVLIRGVHVSLTQGLKDHVQAHLVDPILSFYDNEAAEIDVQLADMNGPKGGEDKECRVTLHIPGSAAVHVQEATDDLYKSVDLARDRLEKALKRELEKRRQQSGHPVPHPSTLL